MQQADEPASKRHKVENVQEKLAQIPPMGWSNPTASNVGSKQSEMSLDVGLDSLDTIELASKRHIEENVQEKLAQIPPLGYSHPTASNIEGKKSEMSLDLGLDSLDIIEIQSSPCVSEPWPVVNALKDHEVLRECMGRQYFKVPKFIGGILDFEIPATELLRKVAVVAGSFRHRLTDINRLLCEGAYRNLEEFIFHICSRVYVKPAKTFSLKEGTLSLDRKEILKVMEKCLSDKCFDHFWINKEIKDSYELPEVTMSKIVLFSSERPYLDSQLPGFDLPYDKEITGTCEELQLSAPQLYSMRLNNFLRSDSSFMNYEAGRLEVVPISGTSNHGNDSAFLGYPAGSLEVIPQRATNKDMQLPEIDFNAAKKKKLRKMLNGLSQDQLQIVLQFAANEIITAPNEKEIELNIQDLSNHCLTELWHFALYCETGQPMHPSIMGKVLEIQMMMQQAEQNPHAMLTPNIGQTQAAMMNMLQFDPNSNLGQMEKLLDPNALPPTQISQPLSRNMNPVQQPTQEEMPYVPQQIRQRSVYSGERKSAMIAFWHKHNWLNCTDEDLTEFCATYGVTKQQMKCFRGNHKVKFCGRTRGVKRKLSRKMKLKEEMIIQNYGKINFPTAVDAMAVAGAKSFLA